MPDSTKAMREALAEVDGNCVKLYWTGDEWCAEVNTADRDGFQHLAATPVDAVRKALEQVERDAS